MKTLLVLISLATPTLVGCAPESHPAGQASPTVAVPADGARIAYAYLEITLKVDASNRPAAAAVYTKYKQPFLDTVPGAISKQLLVRGEDVVVLHGFDNAQHAADYLKSSLFTNDVVIALKPLLAASPDVRVYSAAGPADAARSAFAYLQITLKVDPSNRPAAAAVYTKYKQPFLDTAPGAISKQLLVRDEDVVVLHGFDNAQHAADYLKSSLFTNDVVIALKPLLAASPDVRVYSTP